MRSMLVVDDDEISREILSVFAAAAGYRVSVAVSGDAALAALGGGTRSLPDVIVADVQMTGTAGERLATRLRTTCGGRPKLIAMSASKASPRGFDSFIQKPFTLEEFQTAVDGTGLEVRDAVPPAVDPATLPVLDEDVFRTLQRSLPEADLSALYALCLDDTLRRVKRMRYARRAGLTDLYRREAHAIRGSCGFVGAGRLCGLATAMEQQGLERVPERVPESDSGSDPLDVLLAERDLFRHTIASHGIVGALTGSPEQTQRHGP